MSQITRTLPVSGMHCASCASVIKRQLQKMTGVEACEVNNGTEKARVSFDPLKTSISKMNQEIGKLGYALVGDDMPADHNIHQGHDMMNPISSDRKVKERKLQELAKLKTHVQIVLPMVTISVIVMMWEIGAEPLNFWPMMSPVIEEFFHHLLPIFATYVLFTIGVPYLQGVARFIKYRVANMDTLVGIGTLVAFGYSFMLSAFETQLSSMINTQQAYYDVTIVVIGLITLGKYLEARSKLRTGEAIEKLLSLQAKSALVLRDGKEIEVPIEQLVVGDIMIVKPGQKIAVDGEIVEGSSAIDESMITGESIPVDKKIGDSVIGATLNKQGSLRVRATQVGSHTVLSQIIKMVEEAQGSKAPIEKLADIISSVFVPVVLIFATLVLMAWMIVGSQFMPFSQALALGLVSFVGTLVIACPCAMGLATPTAVITGVGRAAQEGILIKNAESLEKLSTIDFIVMDKTGTVTKGQPEVTDIEPVVKSSETEVLKLLSSLEQHSEHPLAQAVVDRAKSQKITLGKVSDFANIEGKGLRGKIEGELYYAGNLKLAQDLSLNVDNDIIDRLTSSGKTPVVLMTKKKILAYIAIADTIKDDAKKTVAILHKQGMKVAMLTGDNRRTASYIAAQVGIDTVIAEVLPGDKAQEIKKLQRQGRKVAMVGDGINDAPALATADVGIAMGTGTDVAIESAGVTLLGGHISKLPKAVSLARSTMSIVKQNLFWAFFYNVIGIPIAAGILYPFLGILLNPALAGAAMAFSSVSVVVNSLRLKRVRI